MSYAGDITPEETWKLLSENSDAVLVDVRTAAEWRFVGVPDLSPLDRDVVYIEWNRTDGTRNDGFVDDLRAAGITPGRPVAFLCRTGTRSVGAAKAATAAGIEPSYNILDGFEGNLDEHKHRGGTGWKAVGLPWVQS
ncbi:rhodanese-like domain-containing protein [Mycobacterium sp. Y57]|uniref:rhodanese-like domain-containing protein n=1 Tax=Mycolicibacterium xanthum TaxID=2796469 RepID=UPI001C84A085|nr:rhodanese-like domain-containing protein [Mycolicibacterium xanthum]MBX7431962.1 rhodanese-like domain-containing protein [Mycolicibacterium xanthum]